MSYPFDRTQFEAARAVDAPQTYMTKRRLSRRLARQSRREARAL